MTWETVIGLEVHVQLLTRTKMFCGCTNRFGAAPNTQVCPVCLGLPGALPVPNEHAIRLATRAALALGCTVHPTSVFARKNYFYPDLPKGYQISQFDQPLATGGALVIESPERGRLRLGITRLHVEEDAGKSLHDRLPGRTAVDLNRAGTPLAEIVSEPDMRSPGEARAYLTTLKQVLLYCEISDCNMEEGSLRVDANISIRKAGDTRLGTKTEVKNMNSFANVERALQVERDRQIALVESGGQVEQVTMLFNAGTGEVRPMRSKEESHDYRYFPDPDLPPLVLSHLWVERQHAALPELPEAKRERFMALHGLPPYDAGVLAAERPVADYFEAVVARGVEPKTASNWVINDAIRAYNEGGQFIVTPERLAELVALVKDGTVSNQAAKRIFGELGAGTEAPRAIAERMGLLQVGDADALGQWVDEVLAANPNEVERYRGGETKLMGFFTGQVMKKSGGKADPKKVAPLLLEKLT
ncbi:MAG: Asp-tRNA(Asn)/Glu-tRNA(Gln) amidotransferase subunit GatB [Gemmatimonadetes bacterium]|nr:Asp-tRNA(Asn)/Glu-tRNA(Gln) amidotransferase subunit GatB [Gemmatimonadota bacterium]MBK7924371.1 Asp-tRNA(Asn)/Glu-tRNA(Gln) amidotransferase subunit GatB [Gemmatimonadota bacterium]